MPKLSTRVGQFSAEVKDFVASGFGGRFTLSHVRAAAARALDVVFPAHDGEGRGLQGGMAAADWSRIRFLADEGCDMCARPFQGGLVFGAGARCSDCSASPFPFVRTRAACVYDEASRGVILAFKHGDRLDHAPMLLRWLQRAGAGLVTQVDVIVPVPLHPSRLRKRRYNQAAELARPLAREAGVAYLPEGLKRIKQTKPQGNSPEARWENVRTAFAAGDLKRLAGKRILLVDDVFTTGATLRACARTLLAAGAHSVDVLVLARVVPSQSV